MTAVRLDVAFAVARGMARPGELRTEAEFLRAVLMVATWGGWRAVHHRPSVSASGRWRTAVSGDAGSPDLLLARGGQVLHVELKTDRGRLGPGQAEWAAAIGPSCRLWRPADWSRIVDTLA
jgi:hypothetical protein